MRRYLLHVVGWTGALLVVLGGWQRSRPGAVRELELSGATAGWLVPMAIGSVLCGAVTVLAVRRWWRDLAARSPR